MVDVQGYFLLIVNKCAPLKPVRIKQRTEMWINSEIFALIRERNIAYKKMKKDIGNLEFAKNINSYEIWYKGR